MKNRRDAMQGFGAIAAIVVLVVMAALAAAIVRLSSAQQTGQTQDLLAARATQAARTGIEWGLYQALKGSWTTCAAGTNQTIDLSSESGMRVTVSCSSTLFNEGESAPGTPQTVRVYTLDAVACNSTTSCPDAARAITPSYVERKLQVQATN